MSAKFSVSPGDKVAYSVVFLESIGMAHSDMAHARGVVTQVTQLGPETRLATIAWDRDMPARVNVANLARVGPNSRFAKC